MKKTRLALVALGLAISGFAVAEEWKAAGEPTSVSIVEKEIVEKEIVEKEIVEKEILDPNRREFGALPALGYSTDNGLGMGLVWTLVQFDPDRDPFRWKLYGLVQASLKNDDVNGLTVPSYNNFLEIDSPGLSGGWLRIKTRAQIERMLDTPYHGFGNLAPDDEPWLQYDPEVDPDAYQEAHRYNTYDRLTPYHTFEARMTLKDNSTPEQRNQLDALALSELRHHRATVYPNSKLQEDINAMVSSDADGETMRSLLYGTDDHVLWMLGTGLAVDTRDHEYTPLAGTFSQISVWGSPGVSDKLLFGRVEADARYYQALVGEKLSLAARVMGRVYAGRAPFYLLGDFGGSDSLRGVKWGRYRGRIHLVESVELRSKLLDFELGGQRFNLGVTGFFDSGRVWTDFGPTELDGASLDGSFGDFHTGLGLGPRLMWGETFLVRIDYGISPSDDTSGLYITIGHQY